MIFSFLKIDGYTKLIKSQAFGPIYRFFGLEFIFIYEFIGISVPKVKTKSG